jgi:hypothetical protein
MRRLAVLLLGVTLLTLAAVPAAAGSRRQVVEGQVLTPTGTRLVGPAWVGACEFLHATAGWAFGSQGLVAYRFPVATYTRGTRFVLTPDGAADLDITFTGSGQRRFFEAREFAEEGGIVPSRAVYGTVCLVAGGPTSFTYRAG